MPLLLGHIDGREFDGARDTDDFFRPILEVLIEDQYAWFPFEAIGQLRIAPSSRYAIIISSRPVCARRAEKCGRCIYPRFMPGATTMRMICCAPDI